MQKEMETLTSFKIIFYFVIIELSVLVMVLIDMKK